MNENEQLRHSYDAMIAARQAIYDAKRAVAHIPGAIAMPIMVVLQQQIDALNAPIEAARQQLVALSQA